MQMTADGSLRPTRTDTLTAQQTAHLLAACPGVCIEPRPDPQPGAHLKHDLVWGDYYRIQKTWARDADLRFRAATGGTLSALAIHLLNSNKVDFVLHVGADPEQPMRSRSSMSENPQQVIANSISRYGPTSPLVDFEQALQRNQPFALIAKPCDLNAVARLAKIDDRVDRLCLYRLCMVCGGQSKLRKSWNVIAEHGLDESEVSVFRYRGYGNPGKIRIESCDGRAWERSYMSFWEDESSWDVETRCKFCPDALGEAADIAAADYWPGGNPVAEDAGFNFVISHTQRGESLLNDAIDTGDLVAGEDLDIDQINDAQPHQLRKKQAVLARIEGLDLAGLCTLDAPGYRLQQLDKALTAEQREHQQQGVVERVKQGRIREQLP